MATACKKPETEKTTKSFSAQTVQALVEYVDQVCGGRMLASDIEKFYKAHPEYKSAFSNRLGALARLYPAKVRVITNSGNDWIETLTERMGNAAEPGKTQISDGNLVKIGKVEQYRSAFAEIHVAFQGAEGATIDCSADVIYINRTLADLWSSCSQVAISVEAKGDQVSVIGMFGQNQQQVLLIDVLSAKEDLQCFLVSCGLASFLLNSERTVVCFDIKRLRRLIPTLSIAKIWDVKVTSSVLSGVPAAGISLGSLLEDYDVQVKFESGLLEVSDWCQRPLSLNQVRSAARQVKYLLDLYERMRDDAYSSNKVDVCLRRSEAAAIDLGPTPSLSLIEEQLQRFVRDPTTPKSLAESTDRVAVQTFKSKASSAKRREALREKFLPANACFHFHVATPSECQHGSACKFLHEI